MRVGGGEEDKGGKIRRKRRGKETFPMSDVTSNPVS